MHTHHTKQRLLDVTALDSSQNVHFIPHVDPRKISFLCIYTRQLTQWSVYFAYDEKGEQEGQLLSCSVS